MAEPIVLVVSTMFPNRALPVHAVFVQQRIQALARRVSLEVCSPVPTFPVVDQVVGKYAHRRDIPAFEEQGGLRCHFPRFTSLPMVAKPLDGWAVYRTLRSFLDRPEFRDRVVHLDAHLAFPDGWAAVRLARERNLPVTVTLRGHDINELAATRGRRRMVIEALRGADRVFGVAKALCDGARELAPDARTVVSSNGVDPERFHPVDRRLARRELGLPEDARIVVAVGHLVRRKGVHHLLEAAGQLRSAGRDTVHVVVVGAPGEEGNFEPELRRIAESPALRGAVHFVGAIPNPELHRWYSAADVSCLASEKEGWPNVVLESLACGVPVVATAVWGTPEILCRDDLGLLTPYGEVDALASRLAEAFDREWDADGLRAYACEHTWDDTAAKLVERFEEIHRERGTTLPRLESA